MIYVDESKWGTGQWWCHMMTDQDIDELHTFAQSIGLKRRWFQPHSLHPHYDLSLSKRRQAISNGATQVSSRDMVIACSKYKPVK